MTISPKISRATAENIVRTLRQTGDALPGKFDPVELIAASHALSIELRGFRPDTTTGRKDAASAYIRQLPKDPTVATLHLKRAAAEALDEPQILEQFQREQVAEAELARAEAALAKIREAPLRRAARLAEGRRAVTRLQREETFWSQDFAAIAEQNLSHVRENAGKHDSVTGQPSVNCSSALAAISANRILSELAPGQLTEIRAKLTRLHEELAAL